MQVEQFDQREQEHFVKLVVTYLQEMNEMVKALTGISIVNEDVTEHVKETWNDNTAKHVYVQLMNAVVVKICGFDQPQEKDINPFCIYQNKYSDGTCNGCFYAIENGSCHKKDSLWGEVRTKLHSTISDVLDYERFLMVLWLDF